MKTFPRILLLVGTSYGFGRTLIDGVSQYVFEHGGLLDYGFRGHTEPIPSWLKRWEGDGVIVRHHMPQTFEILEEMQIPYVKLYCADTVSDIDTDEDALAAMAITYFQGRGHSHFAVFSQEGFLWASRRENAYLHYLKQHGIPCHVFHGPADMSKPFSTWHKQQQGSLIKWLQDLPKPIGLLAINDLYAKHVLDVCREHNISVPEEIAVLGVNNERWFCRLQNPPLSSIYNSGHESGYAAAQMLYRMIHGKKRPISQLLFPPVSIETRTSTDVIAISDPDLVTAAQYIRIHCDRPLLVTEVVQNVGLSRRTLERKYLKQFGRTLGHDITNLRMEKCCEYLRDTDIQVGLISKRLGFSSFGYFINIFRQHFGVTPSEYRRRFRPAEVNLPDEEET